MPTTPSAPRRNHDEDRDTTITEWVTTSGRLHRLDGPAYVGYYPDGYRHEDWRHVGDRHRLDGPATATAGATNTEGITLSWRENRNEIVCIRAVTPPHNPRRP